MEEKIVEVMARAMDPNAWLDVPTYELQSVIPRRKASVRNAKRALAALRAENCEVVQWRPMSDGYQYVGNERQYVNWPRRGNTTHFAILTGPTQEKKHD